MLLTKEYQLAITKEELGYLAIHIERLRSAIVQTNVNNHEEEKIESISTTNGTFLQLPVAVLPAAALLVGIGNWWASYSNDIVAHFYKLAVTQF